MKKCLANLLIFIILISISSAVFAFGHATSLPPSITIEGVGGGLVCLDSGAQLRTQGGDYNELKDLPHTVGWGDYNEYYANFGEQNSKTYYNSKSSGSGNNVMWYIAANTSGAAKQAAVWGQTSTIVTKWVGEAAVGTANAITSAAHDADTFLQNGVSISNNTIRDNVDVKNYNGKVIVGPYNVTIPDNRFFKITGQYIIDEEGNKIKDVDIAITDGTNIIEGGAITSGKDFHIIYDPHNEDGTLIPYAKLKFDYTYLSGFTDTKYDIYDGETLYVSYIQEHDYEYSDSCNTEDCGLTHYLGTYHNITDIYLYTKEEKPIKAQQVADIQAKEAWTDKSYELDIPDHKAEFDLSLKKFISKVDGVDTNRVPQESVSGLTSKISKNAVYSKIYTPYRILSNVKEFTYTIRIYNEGDIAGRATKIQDHLPEGLSIVSVESSGYTWNESTWNTDDKRIITFYEANKGDVQDIPKFDGTLHYTDIKITCKVDKSAYDDMEDEQKVYDLSMTQYIDSEGTKTKTVQTGDEVTYTLKVTNEGEEAVYLKEIKQTLPKGLEFADDGNKWNVIKNSDGTTVCSMIICKNIEVGTQREETIKCKVTATTGTLKTVSEIVGTDKPDIDWKKDWTDFAKVTVGAAPEEAYIDLELEQTVEGDSAVETGTIVKYKITVRNKAEDSRKVTASKIKIASYIPDGMKFIPPDTDDEYEELKEISKNESEFENADNSIWCYNQNRNAVELEEGIDEGDLVYLYCVVTTDKQEDLKNIAEIISFEGGTDIDSTPDNVNYDAYLYEKQEDDDAFTIVSTKDSSNTSDLKITTEVTNDDIRTIEYEIAIVNQGDKDATVTIKDILEGMEYTGITDTTVTYDKASKIITFKDIEIPAGQTKPINVQCKVTAEKAIIELVNSTDEASESEIEEQNKTIKHTAYIERADIYDKTKADWQTQEERIVKAEEKELEEQESENVKKYEKYLTNKAMIIETSQTDRDTSDWKDSETIIIDDEGKRKTEIKVIKKWDHGAKPKEDWPDSVEVILYADGVECDRTILNKDNNWECIFKNLDRSKTYTVSEVAVTGYTTEITKNGNVYTIENTYPGIIISPRDITVVKKWIDDNNKYGLRPGSITVKLIDESGKVCKTTELNESNNWQHTFKNLPEGVNYTVDEENVPYYTKSIDGYTITNSYDKDPGDDPDPGTDPILPVGIPITMEIAGNVFEDVPSTKAGETDNKLGVEDGMLAGIEVTLYEEDGKTVVKKLYQQHEENPNISEADSEIRVNPTITDEYGNYSFKGLDPTKKYKVKFKYNGLVYEAVKCDDQAEYNTEDWRVSSKAVENILEREALNTKFSEISASPNNYENGKVFLQADLENDRIYDGQNIYELITSKIREKIEENKAYPNIEDIYNVIIANYSADPEIAEKIQFIKDCQIEAETNRVYPVYDEFVIDTSSGNIKIGKDGVTSTQTKYIGSGDDIRNYTDKYKEIKEELQKIVNIIKGTDEKFENINYNLDWYFIIDETTVQEDGIKGSFNVPIYKIEAVEEGGSYKVKVVEDTDAAGRGGIENQLAWSLNTAISTDFSGEGASEYEANSNMIFNIFNAHGSRIKQIVAEIIADVTDYYNKNFEVLPIGSINEDVQNIYPGQKQIHLGLVKREEFDLTIAKDVYQVDLSINGQNITYNYNNVDIDAYTGDWVAEVRANNNFYERNIYASDYHYHEINGTDKLTMSVTYRIALRNQKAGIIGEIIEIVDYYDKDYTFESIHISDGKNSEEAKIACAWENSSKYSNYEYKEHNDLNVGFITLGNEGLIESEKDKFIYITFKVNEDAEGIIVDGRIKPDGLKEYADSKQNIVEINGYKTYYKGNTTSYNGQDKSNMTPAGVLDKDSIPGNYVPSENYDSNKKQYYADEDDVGVANGIYILVDYYNQRTIEGTIWEDEAIETLLSQNIRQGDGAFTDNEKPIQNVKATLMNYNADNDKYEDGSIVQYYDIDLDAWVDLAVHTNKDGKYSLKGFVPGVYDVWFTYDNNSINRELDSEAYNETRYNGQDYKSTIYKEKEIEGKWYLDESNRMSDAKDVWTRREEVNAYSKTLTNDIAESLIPSDLDGYAVEKTTMYARTDKLQIDVEYDKTEVQNTSYTYETKDENTNEVKNELKAKNDYSKYVIDNVDFGLVERPRAQLSIQNNISNVKVILADKTVLFDAIPTESGKFEYTNLGSIARKLATAYVETKEAESADTITKLKNSTHVSTEQGRITMNMDEELMQGANLQVTYEISVENIGELDYNNKNFYDYGATVTDNGGNIVITIPDDSNLVTTKVEQIIDYVENNMKFSNTLNNEEINKGWEVKTQGDIGTDVVLKDTVIKALFNENTIETDDAFNTIVALDSSISDTYDASGKFESTTNNATKPLMPGDTTSSDFILTQLISPENDNDDLTYKNVLEIVKSSNSVGRRMYFSIAGNHVPVERDDDNPAKILGTSLRPEGREIDTDDGELITIIPPFGANMIKNTNYAILAITLVAVFGVGVYLIKKKVLK